MTEDAAGSGAPLLHFSHATGMCAGIYRPLIERLGAVFEVIASDARGHGTSRLPADPARLVDWVTYRDDLSALIDTLPADRPLVLAGHSMGATVSMEVAARRPDRVAAVAMIEPAFVPFAMAADHVAASAAVGPPTNPLAEQARRRRARWPSRAAARAAYRGRGVFARWDDTALDAYLDGGLLDRPDGSVELACRPAWEAATFRAVSAGLAGAVASWRGPLVLLHGTEGSTVGTDDAAAIVALCPGATRHCFPGTDHFLPLQAPEAMSAAISALLCRGAT